MSATLGTFFELGGRGTIEALAHTGLDYVIIDAEHGCFSVETIADYIVTAERHGLIPYVRIGDTHRDSVLPVLDVGARGLIVPNIHSLEEVHELVEVAKFPPLGKRGFCPNRTSGWGAESWATDVDAYMAESNQRVKVMPQCETAEALEQVETLAAVDGVDGIFIGPFDLSIDLGIPLQLDHPTLLEAIERVLAACNTNGKESTIFASTIDDARRWISAGFDSVTFDLDATMLINAYRTAISDIRA